MLLRKSTHIEFVIFSIGSLFRSIRVVKCTIDYTGHELHARCTAGVVALVLDLPCTDCKKAAREFLPSHPILSAVANKTARGSPSGMLFPNFSPPGRAHGLDTWRLRSSWLGQRTDTLWTKGTLLMVVDPSTATLKLACCPRFPLPAIARLVVRAFLTPVR